MRNTSCSLVAALVICCISAVAQAGVAEVQSYRSPGEFDRAAWDAEQQRLLAWLVAEQVEAGLAAPLEIKLSEQELREIEAGFNVDSGSARSALLVGVVKPVDLSFELGSSSHGAERRTADGVVWSAAIHSDFAAGIRVHFEGFSLPEGFELWLYSASGVRGPYSGSGPDGSGDFWSHSVAGSDAVLQLRGPVTGTAERLASFAVTEVGHIGQAAQLKSFCDNYPIENAWCVENINCANPDPAVNVARDAVALMRYVKRPYIYLCSGGLLNDSASSGTPYFLTANHCISRDREAGTLETWFGYTATCDVTNCTNPFSGLSGPSVVGASVLATSSTSDFTLLRLSAAPGGAGFLGWTEAPVAFSDGSGLFRVSHPGGAPQAYSEHAVSTTARTCSSWPRGSWIYSRDTLGATEGGSSGSPVVNAQGQVVGQLSGACGTNLNDNCDTVSNATVDGAFAAYYDQVAPWLGGGGGCDPVPEICNNYIDDDCDGLIDEADPDCGGGTCLPAGDPCTTGTDCCSGLCHPRKLTCK